MIIIKTKSEESKIFVPKGPSAGESGFSFVLKSEITQAEYSFDVMDLGGSSQYYKFIINTTGIPDGEYNYTVSEDGSKVCDGLIQVGNVDAYSTMIFDPTSGEGQIIQYQGDNNFLRVEEKDVAVDDNGEYSFVPSPGFDVMSQLNLTVDVNVQPYYESGFTAGYTSGHTDGYEEGYASGNTDGYNTGYGVGFSSGQTVGYNFGYSAGYESGSTDGYASGYTSGQTDGYASGYTSGKTDGDAEGYQRGYTSGKTDGDAEGYQRGYTSGETAGYASGYTAGFEAGTQSGATEAYEIGFQAGYASGNTDGYAAGYASGNTDGYNTGYAAGFESGKTEGYTSGLTVGYTSGTTDGYAAGYESGSTDGYNSGYASGRTDGESAGYDVGYNRGYTSGSTDGYASGYTSGQTDGYASGYSSGQTDGYASGMTDGYASGYTCGQTAGYGSGYTSGHTDGYASGYASGQTDGYASGYTCGQTDGYASGYTNGYSAATESLTNFTLELAMNCDYDTPSGAVYTLNIEDEETTTHTFTPGQTDTYHIFPGKEYSIAFSDVSGYTKPQTIAGIARYDETLQINVWYRTTNPAYKNFTIEATEEGILRIHTNSYTGLGFVSFDLRKNGGSWERVTNTKEVYLNSGDTVEFKATSERAWQNHFEGDTTLRYKVYGNIATLCSPIPVDSISIASAFTSSFENCINIVNASELYIPSTVDGNYAFKSMFKNCTNLTSAPELRMSAISDYGCASMFEGCTALLTAPVISATTVGVAACDSMFKNCTNLDSAMAVLPAQRLSMYSYAGMFYSCLNLVSAPELPATGLAQSCYSQMFYSCDSLVDGPSTIPAPALASSCCNQMFYGCSSLATAPTLPATYLSQGCYTQMFQGCSSLNSITCLATNISASNCVYNWVSGVAATGTFKKNGSMTSWPSGSSGIPTGWTVKNDGPEYEYLTVTNLSGGSLVFKDVYQNNSIDVEYSLNDGAWTTLSSSYAGTELPLTPGDQVRLRGTNASYNNHRLTVTSASTLSGNIMSLIHGDGFETGTTISSSNAFNSLFYYGKYTDAENLALPATGLTEGCYQNLFYYNSLLTKAPKKLPATVMALSCYSSMFEGCTNLTTVPRLSGQTLAESCYSSMFKYCRNITAGPQLNASTLASWCYSSMFDGCYALTSTPELPAKTLDIGCYYHMFQSCRSMTESPVLKAASVPMYGYDNMFNGCTSLTKITCWATTLTADATANWVNGVAASGEFVKACSMTGWTIGVTGIPSGWTVSNNPYEYLTIECTTSGSLNFKKSNGATEKSVYYSTDGENWQTATFGTTSALTMTAGDKLYLMGYNQELGYDQGYYYNITSNAGQYKIYGNVMSLIDGDEYYWLNQIQDYTFNSLFRGLNVTDASGLILPATSVPTGGYMCMFSGCTSLTAAPALPATTVGNRGYAYMFSDCTALTTSPDINCENWGGYAGSCMFSGCTALTSAGLALKSTTLNSNCFNCMYYGCTSLTTAPQLTATTIPYGGYEAMFYGCSSLNSVTCLATNRGAVYATYNWLGGVAATGTLYKAVGQTWETGVNGIPSGWTQVDSISGDAD